jgi:hypothetical protein
MHSSNDTPAYEIARNSGQRLSAMPEGDAKL